MVLAPEGPQRDDLAPDVAAALEADPRPPPSSTRSPSSIEGGICAGSMPPSAAPTCGRHASPRWSSCARTESRNRDDEASIQRLNRLSAHSRGPDDGQVTVAKTVGDYLRALPPDVQKALEGLRRAIKEAAPDAAETISYRVPTFSQGGPLVGFGAAKNHCSFYVMSPSLVSSLGDELKPYDVSDATIRFKVGEPLPPSLVTRVVVARIEENAARKKS